MNQGTNNEIKQNLFTRLKTKFLRLTLRSQIFAAIGTLALITVLVVGATTIIDVGNPDSIDGVVLRFSPVDATVAPGDTLTVALVLDTAGQNVSAVSAVFDIDTSRLDLTCTDVGNCLDISIGANWSTIAELSFSGTEVSIAVGTNTPVNGSGVQVAVISFTIPAGAPDGEATADFNTSDSAVVLDDGFGTNILDQVNNESWTVDSSSGALVVLTDGPIAVVADCSTSPTATISWTLNRPADGQVAYRTTPCPGCDWTTFSSGASLAPPTPTPEALSHSIVLSGLSTDTTYYYQVRSETSDGAVVVSAEQSFFTGCILEPTVTLEITNLSVEPFARSAVVSWNTNLLADSTLTVDGLTFTDSILTLSHSLRALPLLPNTTYTATVTSSTSGGETASDSIEFTTLDEDLSLDSNIVLQVERDRVCGEWLSCASSVAIVDTANNLQTFCFDRTLCDKLDPNTGACLNPKLTVPGSGVQTDFRIAAGEPGQSTIDNAQLLSGYTKAGATWQGFDESGQIPGYFPYAAMAQLGSSQGIPNGDLETRHVFPWTPRFDIGPGRTSVAEIINTQDRTDLSRDLNRVLSVRPAIQPEGVSGVKVPLGKTLRADRQYYVTFDVRAEDSSISDLLVQFGFHNYITFSPADRIAVTTGWQRVIAGPLEVSTGDLPQSSEQNYLGILVETDSFVAGEPVKPFYIDNIRIEPVLNVAPGEVSPESHISRSCRQYPAEDAPVCRYFDANTGRELQGWEGFCLETDPRNSRRCIQWLPVDLIAGSSSALTAYAQAGYGTEPDDRVPLYYCTAARGNAPYIRAITNANEVFGLRVDPNDSNNLINAVSCKDFDDQGPATMLVCLGDTEFGGWESESGLIRFAASAFSVSTENDLVIPLTDLHKWEIEQIRVVVGATQSSDWPRGSTYSLNHANDWETAVCTSDGCSNETTIYTNNKSPFYWKNIVNNNQDSATVKGCEGDFGGGDNSNANLFGIQVNFDEQGIATSIEAGLCDGSNSAGWLELNLEVYLREWCVEVAQVVTPFGANTAWADRIHNASKPVPGLGYRLNRDLAPFGGIVAPEPDFDPSRWDSSTDESGGQPLYVEPANQTQFFQAPYQARASSPYRSDLDSSAVPAFPRSIGVGVCVSGSKLGAECDGHDDCGLGNDGSPGRCTGVVPPSSIASTDDFLSSLQKASFQVGLDDINIQNLFARSQQVWRWSDAVRQYISNGTFGCPVPGKCIGGFGWDITDDTTIAKPPRVDNLRLKPGGRGTYDSTLNAYVFAEDFATVSVEFNSIVDPEQLPLVRYTVDWGDEHTSEETNLRIASQSFRPHVLTHTYIKDETLPNCDADGCTFTPRVQIEDNWGWCSGAPANGSSNYAGDGTACDSWDLVDEDVIVGSGTANLSPIAIADAVPTSGDTPLTVAFTGSNSVDVDGTIVSYSWTFGDGGTSTVADPSYTYSAAGTYTATLTVTDDDGATGTDTVTITVNAVSTTACSDGLDNDGDLLIDLADPGCTDSSDDDETDLVPFFISITPASQSVLPGETATFVVTVEDSTIDANIFFVATGCGSATCTFVPDNCDVTIGGTCSVNLEVFVPAGSAGTISLTVTGTADSGESDSETATLNIGTNTLPSASFFWSEAGATLIPWLIDFDASSSSDPDGTIVSYLWEFGDGTPDGAGVTTQHSYTAAGSFLVTLTVTDDNGGTDSVTQTISPSNLAPDSPTALSQLFSGIEEGEGISSGDATPRFEFTITDPDGDDVSYQIQAADNSAFSSPNIDFTWNTGSLPSGSRFGFDVLLADALAVGDYFWRVRAIDDSGAQSTWVEFGSSGVVDFNINWWDPAYGLRQRLTINNNQASTLLAPFPTQLVLNTAGLVSAGQMQSNGNDLRIVYDDGSVLHEIDRHVISMNTSSSFIWLSTQANIPASGSDNNYWLYYDNSGAGSPPVGLNNVFYPSVSSLPCDAGNSCIDSNTVSVYHFEDGTGTTLADTAGSVQNGTLTNMTPASDWVAGRFGLGLDFDGTNDYVEIAHNAVFSLTAGTIETWALLDTFDNEMGIFSKDHLGQATPGHLFLRANDQILDGLVAARMQDLSNSYFARGQGWTGSTLGTWVHLAYTWGSAGLNLYINGTLAETNSTTQNTIGNTEPFRLGANTARYDAGDPVSNPIDEFFNGRLDAFRISNIQRTSYPYASVSNDPSIIAGSQESIALALPNFGVGQQRVAGAKDIKTKKHKNIKTNIEFYQIWTPFVSLYRFLVGLF